MMTNKPERTYIPEGLYTFHAATAKKALGSRIWDDRGKEYIDLTSGLGVCHLGHGNERLKTAMEAQLRDLPHMSPHIMGFESYYALAERLHEIRPFPGAAKCYLSNSGAEAVENAVRIARCASGKRGVVAFHGGYHGRTLLGSTLTSRAVPYRKGFGPLAPEVYHVPYAYCYRCPWDLDHPGCRRRCLQALDDLFFLVCPPEETAAVIVEIVQGEGGVVAPPDEFFKALEAKCRDNDVLVIVDEVQTGLYRTGRCFALDHSGIEPDVLVLGKALGGGLPLSAVLGKKDVMDAPHGSGLGGTFGGNPVACAAAVELMEIFNSEKEGLIRNVEAIESRIMERGAHWKSRFSFVGDVRGKGAMMGIELVKDPSTKEPYPGRVRKIVRLCFENGVILLSGGLHRNVLRLLPPLNIPLGDLDAGLDAIEAAFVLAEKESAA